MNSEYVYAGARAKTMENKLLSPAQLDRLLTSKDLHEALKVLQDTYLAPYLAGEYAGNVTGALDASILDAKKTLLSIAPDPSILAILWIKYDFHNLKSIIKGRRIGNGDSDILERCFRGGTVTPEDMLRAFDGKTLGNHCVHFATAARDAETADTPFDIDTSLNASYFAALREHAAGTKEPFVKRYVALLVDLANVKSALRAEYMNGDGERRLYIPGGTIGIERLNSPRAVIQSLPSLGGPALWREAISEYEETGSYLPIEKAADHCILSFLKDESRDVFTPASLFAYFTAKKNNAQVIGAVIVAKRSGMTERDLRTIMRRVYT